MTSIEPVAKRRKERHIWEFGDFQTPPSLARKVVRLLSRLNIEPSSIIEPTCGLGAFVLAAAQQFPNARVLGVDTNIDHLEKCRRSATSEISKGQVTLTHADFFTYNWEEELRRSGQMLLILGNPPWVTNSDLGHLGSTNLPAKSNFQGRKGFDAVTGKSNFDISEWMLLRHLDWLKDRQGAIAMLCKTSVARKVLSHAWKHGISISHASIYRIDAMEHFGASVDACLFIITFDYYRSSQECAVFGSLDDREPNQIIGYENGAVVSDLFKYRVWSTLAGGTKEYVWRSGLKHDCSKVMELKRTEAGYQNALGEVVDLEDTYLFPFLKSSDIGNGRINKCRLHTIVTQRAIGEDTAPISQKAPLTWAYLSRHAELLDKRGSSIYRGKPRFSVFGVGEYTFSPWKVAISGFYKRLQFAPVGPIDGRQVIFDDTVYFLPCYSAEEADFVTLLLNSHPAQEFLTALIHWADKRPITIELLKRIDLRAVARSLGIEARYLEMMRVRTSLLSRSDDQGILL